MNSRSQVLGIGTVRPAWQMSQEVAAEASARCCAQTDRQQRLLNHLYRQSTVESRSSVLLKQRANGSASSVIDWFYQPVIQAEDRGPTTAERMAEYRKAAPGLAIDASRSALEDAQTDAGEVTHLISVTCTGFATPGVEAQLIDALGLKRNVNRTQVGFMGCHAALNAMQVADAFARSSKRARVLVCCVELCSLHFQYGWDNQQLVSNALFADGAAAMVIGSPDDRASQKPAWQLAGTASQLSPDTADMMSWHIGDYGFEMSLSPKVPDLLSEHVKPWLSGWLAEHGMTADDVASWAIHPGGPRIVAAVQSSLGLGDDDVAVSREVLRDCGNMSSATLLFILQILRSRDAPLPCVAMSFGPGLVSEAALFV